MGYILPIKSKTQKELEEVDRQRMAQDQVDLMAESQRQRQPSWLGGTGPMSTVGGMEREYARGAEERRIRDEQGRGRTPGAEGSPPGVPLPEVQKASQGGFRGSVSPMAVAAGEAQSWQALALARQEGSNQAFIDWQLEHQAAWPEIQQQPTHLGPSTWRSPVTEGGTEANPNRPLPPGGPPLYPAHITPVPKPQVADPANVAKTGIAITPEFSRALREDDTLAQEIVDRYGPGVVVYEGHPSNWVPGTIGTQRLLQTALGVADVGFIAPTDFVMENALQAGKLLTTAGKPSESGADFKGYSEAIEAFRARPIITQILLGAVFDPLILVGALGLSMRVTRQLATGAVTPLSRKQLLASVKNAAPDITDAEADRATNRIIEEYGKAGGMGPEQRFTAQPPGGWPAPQQPGRADLLKMGGYTGDTGTLGGRGGKADIDYGQSLTRLAARVEATGDPESALGERLIESGRPLDVLEEGYNVGDSIVYKRGVEARMADEGYDPDWVDVDLPATARKIREEAEVNIESGRAKNMRVEEADLLERERAMQAGLDLWEEQQVSRAIREAVPGTIERYMRGLTRDMGGGEFAESTKQDIIRQLTKSDNPAVQEQVFTRYIRTVQRLLSDAAKAEREAVAEGGLPLGVGQRAPLEAGGGRVPGAPPPEYQLVDPEGSLTAPPTFEGVPQRTVSVGPGDPNVGTGRLGPERVAIGGDTPAEKVAASYDLIYQEAKGVSKTTGEVVRETWEDVQGLFVDKYAKWNASATRAEREFITTINEFLEADIKRINAERMQDATSGGLSRNSEQVKAMMVKRGDPGYEAVDRIPAEFNLQVQVSLSSGMPNAGRHVAERVLTEAMQKLRGGGRALRVDPRDLDLFLTLRHSIDIVKLVNKYDPLKKPAGWKGRAKEAEELARRDRPPTERGARTGPSGMTLNDMQGTLWNLREKYRGTYVDGVLVEGSSAYQNLLEGAQVIRTHYSDMLDMQVTEGIVSRETADMLHAQFPYYNPIEYTEGVVQHIVDANKRNAAHLLGVPSNDLKELAKQGIPASVRPPLSILAPQTMAVYSSISRNRVARALIHSLIYDPVWNKRVIKMTDERGRLNTAAARTVVAGEKVGTPDQVNIARMVNGKAEVWSVPKEMGEMITQLGQFDQHFLETALRTINKPQRAFYTAANPIFFVLNFMHDTFASFMKEGIMPWDTGWELMAGLRKMVQGDRWIDDIGDLMKEEGGYVGGLMTGAFKGQDDVLDAMGSPIRNLIRSRGSSTGGGMTGGRLITTQAQTILERGQADPRLFGGVQNRQIEKLSKNTFGKAWSDLQALVKSPLWITANLADAVEQAPRRATFKKVLGQGYSPQEAAYRARQVTIDFKRRGRAMGLYDAAILYGNAAIQGALLPVRAVDPGSLLFNPLKRGRYGSEGWDKFGSGMKRYGPGRLRLAGLTGMGVGLYYWNATQFPESNPNMSLKDKLTTWSIQYGEEYDDYGNLVPKSVSVLPILRELAAPQAPFIYILEKMRENNPADWHQYLTTLLPVINPLSTITNVGGRDANFSWQGLPHGLGIAPVQHMMDIFMNWDSFRNKEIVPADLRALPNAEQYDEHTSEMAKRVGRKTGMSPMKVDQLWNVGVVREFIIAGDQLFRLADDPTYDSELDGIAAEIEGHLDALVGPDKKLRNSTIDSFLYGSAHHYSAEEIKKIKYYIDREGPDIPGVTTMMNRLHRKTGGQLRNYGELQAHREFGIDSNESALAGDQITMLRDDMRDVQIAADEQLWMNHDVPRTDGTTISGKQWIEIRQGQGDAFRISLATLSNIWPSAAQLMGLKEDGLDVSDFDLFKSIIYTGAGNWEDTRLRSQIYSSGYRGIAMTYLGAGTDNPDYATYFRQRDEFRADIIAKEGKNSETYRRFEDDLSRYLSDTERIFQRDMEVLRPYWEMPHQLLLDDPHAANPNLPAKFQGLPRGGVRDIWAKYLASNGDQRTVMDADPETGGVLTGIRRRLGDYRTTYRQTNSAMDVRYIRWGYAVKAETPDGFYELQRLKSLAGEPLISPYEGQPPGDIPVGMPQPPYQPELSTADPRTWPGNR